LNKQIERGVVINVIGGLNEEILCVEVLVSNFQNVSQVKSMRLCLVD